MGKENEGGLEDSGRMTHNLEMSITEAGRLATKRDEFCTAVRSGTSSQA